MEKIIAKAVNDMEDTLIFSSNRMPCDPADGFSCAEYVVTFTEGIYNESNLRNEAHHYTAITRAWSTFKDLLCKYRFETVMLCENFVRDYEEYLDPDYHYTPSATAGDYSPSNPWDAPGMSIRDFI